MLKSTVFAAFLAVAAFSGPAVAGPFSPMQGEVRGAGSDLVLAGWGRGRGHKVKANRGRHLGWYKGRGKAWGRRARHGW